MPTTQTQISSDPIKSGIFPRLFPETTYGYQTGPLSSEEVKTFHRDGYIIKRKYYSQDEVDLLLRIAKADREMLNAAIAVPDSTGKISKLTVWNEVSNDIYSMFSRGNRMVEAMEQLLGDEVYHYHSKMMLKEPSIGGAWEWHQDYGYWYQNGVMWPRMASGLIAVDRASKANGCLQVLKGSHHFGRIEHGVSGSSQITHLLNIRVYNSIHFEFEF
jgi:ectoine hydroxylase-related dioxygenase (phytanoyl-CoA dioxygenase family)